MGCNEKMAVFVYNSSHDCESNKKIDIIAQYVCKDMIDCDRYDLLYKEFNDYLKNYCGDDIVDIVVNLREIFSSLDENELDVSIKDNSVSQDVKYIDGVMDSCSFVINDSETIISIVRNHFGTNVNYSGKSGSLKNMDEIYNKVGVFLPKAYDLHSFINEKSYAKAKGFIR